MAALVLEYHVFLLNFIGMAGLFVNSPVRSLQKLKNSIYKCGLHFLNCIIAIITSEKFLPQAVKLMIIKQFK